MTVTPLLAAKELRKRFGGLRALDGVSFELPGGAILGLIGPNGSGKTTLLNVLNGVYRPDGGDILLQGSSVAGLAPHRLAERGVARTFQNARVFSTITTMENMFVPTLHRSEPASVLRERAERLLEFVGLTDLRDLPASELSGGQQKLLEFARALMTEPSLVLMDEPFAGVHPSVKALLLERIRERNRQGTTFIVVSHEIPDLMGLSDQVLCLANGTVIASGPPDAVTEDEQVVEAYLGRPGGGGAA